MNTQKKKIIIVDDEVSFLDIFGKVLEGSGFEVKKFLSSKEALLKIVEERPDLILLDISMPDITGLEFFEHLRNDFKGKMPKVIFLTNLSETEGGTQLNQDFARDIGAEGYIKKTDDLDKILERIKSELE
ncbi:response regulator [Candidatus Wolfebacteria bacterium]|nr:response regulator [Candidatus Wolfebacteria bacterium]